MAFLKVFSGGEERTIFLGEDRILIGRGQDTDVLLEDVKVSRQHCVIEPIGKGRWRARDLGSGNGTKVNGREIESEELLPEDVVQVGDAKILYASEAASVVEAREPAAARRRAPRKSGSSSAWVFAVLGLVACAAVILFLMGDGGGGEESGTSQEAMAYRAILDTENDRELVELAETFLNRYPRSRYAAEIRSAAEKAQERIENGTSTRARGYDPRKQLEGLTTSAAVARLEEMLLKAGDDERSVVQGVLTEYREKLERDRKKLFDELESVFRDHVEKGEYARAREIWFFLGEEPDWVPLPSEYVERIVQANQDLETRASAERTELFAEIAKAEAAHHFREARKLLVRALPRFQGTSVTRSLHERLEFLDRALREGVKERPRKPTTVVQVDVGRKMRSGLEGLKVRDFEGAAKSLRELARSARKKPGHAEVDARAKECEAAAALHAALVEALAQGKPPRKPVAKRWRVLAGDEKGIRVRTKGEELAYSWKEVPVDLYLALLAPHADRVRDGHLGMVVISHAIGTEEAFLASLAAAYERARKRSRLDRFVAARIREEPLPEGGYVVDAGKLWTRKEYHRRREETLIKGLVEQLDRAYAAIRSDKSLSRLERLKKKKGQLDKAREHALELIYDEKKYFYPYRGTGREGEYSKVQREVDDRVAAVREIWEDRTIVRVKAGSRMERNLGLFDEAAKELERRLVDVEEKVGEVAFLRSYFGKKFDIRNLYRTPDEKRLLDYSAEVVEFNPTVEGDITKAERKQVDITNEYRVMFGRWPVRLVEKLVKSSRGHCEEMSKLGYFGHFSPTRGRKTPYDRMKLEGYEFGASENCVMGTSDPKSAHVRWCHSSGHHRNLLMAAWTEMGTGHHGYYMTQNFGRAPRWSKHDRRREEEAAEILEEEEYGYGPEEGTWDPDEEGETEIEEGEEGGSAQESDSGDDEGEE